MLRIKKNDTVMVISGKDKGKSGVVLEVIPEQEKVKVQGINILVRHVKAKRQGETSTIKRAEGYIHLAKVMPVCPSTQRPSRVRTRVTAEGAKVRVAHHTNETL